MNYHQRRTMLNLLIGCILFLIAYQPANGTSIVAQLEDDRIFLAADVRRNQSDAMGNNSSHDDYCKIRVLGNSAVAVTGRTDYKRSGLSDSLSDWNALDDAEGVYSSALSLTEFASDWARHAIAHYQKFLNVAASRVIELAKPTGVLVGAFIVGWGEHGPLLVYDKVYLDENPLPTVRAFQQVLPPRASPYTTNGITQELIESDSGRSRASAAQWDVARAGFSDQDVDWRKVEFLIKSTADYDTSVGKTVNVLQIPKGGQAIWLQNATCPEGRK
jgi:hypothetical protein